MDIPPAARPNVMAGEAMPQHQKPPTALARIRRLALDNGAIADALEGMEHTISALVSITRRQASDGFDILDRVEASHRGHVNTVEAMAAREAEARTKEKAAAVREGVAQGWVTQLQEKLAEAEQRARRATDLAETESRLRIEDTERHKAEIARLTAAPVEVTDKGRAAVAKPPKTSAAKTPKKAVVLDPDGHPVVALKPVTKKAR